jgi:hypothetical protein
MHGQMNGILPGQSVAGIYEYYLNINRPLNRMQEVSVYSPGFSNKTFDSIAIGGIFKVSLGNHKSGVRNGARI